jgi:hypothetical protein
VTRQSKHDPKLIDESQTHQYTKLERNDQNSYIAILQINGLGNPNWKTGFPLWVGR